MQYQYFEVRKNDLTEARVVSREAQALQAGEVLAKVDRFALTANNITYGVVGDKLGYWKFFPAEEGWGIIPVWGFADVVESLHPDIDVGERLYGYWPMGSHIVLRPGGLKATRLFDTVAHRAELSPVYNAYVRTGKEPHYDSSMDDERMLLFPLYATSFCLHDFLLDNSYFAASQLVIPSASSKTAIGLAYALKNDDNSPDCIGLTSARNYDRTSSLGLYDAVIVYEVLQDIDNRKPTTIVDMSGNGTVLSDLHAHLGDQMMFTSNVGVTHYDANEMGPHFIRERSAMFFAPGHIQKRTKEWGPGEFERKAFEFWYGASIKSRDWLEIVHHSGMDNLAQVFAQVLNGKTEANKGIIVSPDAEIEARNTTTI